MKKAFTFYDVFSLVVWGVIVLVPQNTRYFPIVSCIFLLIYFLFIKQRMLSKTNATPDKEGGFSGMLATLSVTVVGVVYSALVKSELAMILCGGIFLLEVVYAFLKHAFMRK